MISLPSLFLGFNAMWTPGTASFGFRKKQQGRSTGRSLGWGSAGQFVALGYYYRSGRRLILASHDAEDLIPEPFRGQNGDVVLEWIAQRTETSAGDLAQNMGDRGLWSVLQDRLIEDGHLVVPTGPFGGLRELRVRGMYY